MPGNDGRPRSDRGRGPTLSGMDTANDLADARLARFLAEEPVIWLSTVRPDGAPHLVPTWFAWDGETLAYTCEVVMCEALSGGNEQEGRVIGGVLDALEYVALAPDGARRAAEARRTGRSAPVARSLADALIAATAWTLGATLVTRNPRDFERLGIPVLPYD